jgi:glycosyltransferase involved in cell wall biosynthesis
MDISIIIPAHNAENWLGRAIRSCLAQTMERERFEVIVVDDGSNDHTSLIIGDFAGPVRAVHLEENRGLPTALNVGIRKALGRFVLRLDSDDYIHEDMLRITYLYLCYNTDMRAVATDYYLVDETENVLRRVNADEEPIGCGILFRKDDLVALGLYDERLLAHEDRDLRSRFTERWPIVRIPLPLYRYRRHATNMTNDVEHLKKFEKLLKHKQGKGT